MSARAPGHRFEATASWSRGDSPATTALRRFSRASTLSTPSAPALEVSAARTFFGDRDRWNPETLLLGALAECHLLSFLRQAGLSGLDVADAQVHAEGTLRVHADGSGEFVAARLVPHVRWAGAVSSEREDELHAAAHEQCFIARSIAFPVTVMPVTPGEAATPARAE